MTKPLSRPMCDALKLIVDGIVYMRIDPATNKTNVADVMAFRSDGRRVKQATGLRRKTVDALIARGRVGIAPRPSGLYPNYALVLPADKHQRALIANHS